jgi:nucleoside-diphosphate kinase
MFKKMFGGKTKDEEAAAVPESAPAAVAAAPEPAAAAAAAAPVAATERSYIMIKPDGVQRGLVGSIIARFEAKGFKLLALKQASPAREHLEQHYADLSAKKFFPSLIEYMASAPVVAMAWEGDGVVAEGRKMLGATKPSESLMGTIRGDFCIDIGRNVCHGSDCAEAAEAEIALWFPEGVNGYADHSAPWVYEGAAAETVATATAADEQQEEQEEEQEGESSAAAAAGGASAALPSVLDALVAAAVPFEEAVAAEAVAEAEAAVAAEAAEAAVSDVVAAVAATIDGSGAAAAAVAAVAVAAAAAAPEVGAAAPAKTAEEQLAAANAVLQKDLEQARREKANLLKMVSQQHKQIADLKAQLKAAADRTAGTRGGPGGVGGSAAAGAAAAPSVAPPSAAAAGKSPRKARTTAPLPPPRFKKNVQPAAAAAPPPSSPSPSAAAAAAAPQHAARQLPSFKSKPMTKDVTDALAARPAAADDGGGDDGASTAHADRAMVVAELRQACLSGDVEKLKAAIEAADKLGLSFEAGTGRRKLAKLQK